MAFSTILIKNIGEWFMKERAAAEIITPGMILNVDSAGKYEIHNTEGSDGSAIVAVENELIGGEIGDDYASGDQVRAVYAQPGDEILMRLADSENVTFGNILKSDGSGGLVIHTPRAVDEAGSNTWTQYEHPAFFRSLEDRNNSSGLYENIQVEAL